MAIPRPRLPRHRRPATSGTIRCVLEPFRAPDGRLRWYKLVRNVDVALPDGYALGGEFIRAGVEVDIPVGGVLVANEPVGPKRRPTARWYWIRITNSGVPAPGSGDWQAGEAGKFLTFRDDVARALGQELHA